MFKRLFNFAKSQNSLETIVELSKLQETLAIKEEKTNKIKEKFNFSLPDYIIEEIIENEKTKNYINLHYLINCAVVNERISVSNAKLLKQIYSFK